MPAWCLPQHASRVAIRDGLSSTCCPSFRESALDVRPGTPMRPVATDARTGSSLPLSHHLEAVNHHPEAHLRRRSHSLGRAPCMWEPRLDWALSAVKHIVSESRVAKCSQVRPWMAEMGTVRLNSRFSRFLRHSGPVCKTRRRMNPIRCGQFSCKVAFGVRVHGTEGDG